MWRVFILGLLFIAGSGLQAAANPVNFSFRGQITQVNEGGTSISSLDAPLTGTLTFDPGAAINFSSPTLTSYSTSGASADVSFTTFSLLLDFSGPLQLLQGFGDALTFSFPTKGLGGSGTGEVNVTLDFPAGTLEAGEPLPDVLPEPKKTSVSIELFTADGDFSEWSGSLTLSVAEPSTSLGLMTGVVLLGLGRRRYTGSRRVHLAEVAALS